MFGIFYLLALTLTQAPAVAGSGIQRAERPLADPQSAARVLFEDFECNCGRVHLGLASDRHIQAARGEGVGGGNAIRVTYVGGARGSSRVSRRFRLPAKGLEYTLNYDVKFDEDFQYVKGGKLHGLGPDRPVSGGRAVGRNNWSARVMWRGNGKLGTYTYHQNQRGRYGDRGRVVSSFVPRKNTYYAVSLHVRLNNPASLANGFVRLYVNGRLIEQDERLRFRSIDGPQSLISHFMFTTFHGGHDPSWAPRTRDGKYANVHAYFDNLAVYAGERIRMQPGT
jgi:hypothetical protein